MRKSGAFSNIFYNGFSDCDIIYIYNYIYKLYVEFILYSQPIKIRILK